MEKRETKRAGGLAIHKKKKSCSCGGNSITSSEGELVINVARNSFTLPFALPYCIWGGIYLQTVGFASILQDYLPTGITVTVSISGDVITFSYTNGTETDTITVTVPSISLVSYLEMLSNLNTNYLRSNFILFNCNAGTNPQSLDNSDINILKAEGLYLQKVSSDDLGNQLIIPSSRLAINNSVSNMTELYLRNEPIKNETVWVHQFGYVNPAAYAVPFFINFTFTVFISEMINLNAERMSFYEEHAH